VKPGLRLALHLLAEELEELEDWLHERYDASDEGKNDEARHWDTVQRVRNELYRIGREAESLTLVK
jgi:hypothetical protein